MIGMVAHAKGALDHLRYPLGGPHIAIKAVGGGPMRQQQRDLRPLLAAEPRRHAWGWPALERLNALLTSAGEPLAHCPLTHPKRGGDVLLQPPLLFQGPGALAPLFAPVSLLWCSHTASLS